ncbi:MAG: isoprenoid biosynthesis glyoxalase ElbB [Bacteroidales bacterium]|nr:isoprenoid biosynthesis glyoxalase ElbB [Bacteroidales bacterium]
MKKFAVVLSGCGVYDGAEIHEATLTLLAILKNGGTYDVFAPNINQHHVINHITGEEMKETRNVLVESARIARGKIKDLADFDASSYDILIFPGGFGVAKNLSTLAFDGASCKVDLNMEKAVLDMVKATKPIGALCIAPAVIAKIIQGALVTVGNDEPTIQAIENMGSNHQKATHGEIVVDEAFKIVSTPCYMLDANILQIAEGAENVVKKLMQL